MARASQLVAALRPLTELPASLRRLESKELRIRPETTALRLRFPIHRPRYPQLQKSTKLVGVTHCISGANLVWPSCLRWEAPLFKAQLRCCATLMKGEDLEEIV